MSFCPSWASWVVELDNPLFRNNRAKAILDHLGLQPGMRVLDIGCGPGRIAIALARAVAPTGHVVAIDAQSAMLEKARAKARRASLTNIEFRQVEAGAAPLNLGRFDCATLVTVLGEISNRRAALEEIFDCLQDGGVLAVTELIADPHFQSQRSVRALAAAAGFRERNTTGIRISYTMYLEKPLHGR